MVFARPHNINLSQNSMKHDTFNIKSGHNYRCLVKVVCLYVGGKINTVPDY